MRSRKRAFWIVVSLFALVVVAWATTWVAGNSNTGTTAKTLATTLPSVSAHDLIVCGLEVQNYSSNPSVAFSDSLNGAYTMERTVSASSQTAQMWYFLNSAASGSTVTITASWTGLTPNYSQIACGHWTGPWLLDGSGNYQTGSGTAMDSNSIAVNNSNDLVVAYGLAGGGSPSAANGFTAREPSTLAGAYQILEDITASSAIHAQATQTSGAYIMMGQAFKSANAAANPTVSPSSGNVSLTVTLSTTSGAVICWNTAGSPATNHTTGCTTGTAITTNSGTSCVGSSTVCGDITVSSPETVYAIAGGTGYADSAIVTGTYTSASTLRVRRRLVVE